MHNFIPSSIKVSLNTSENENAILENLYNISKTPNSINQILKPYGNNQVKKYNISLIPNSQGSKLNSIKASMSRMNNK